MATLKIWNHPATGETRIYVNGTFRDSSKIWIGENDRLSMKGECQTHSNNIDFKKGSKGTLFSRQEKAAKQLQKRWQLMVSA